jgi:predicted GNAT family acetyltransferase
MDVEVADNPDKARFEIVADGELAGFLQYHLRDGVIALTHTQTDDRFRGHGLGSRLVQASLDDVRARNLVMLPYCPFVNSWIASHREYADLVPAGRREQFGL